MLEFSSGGMTIKPKTFSGYTCSNGVTDIWLMEGGSVNVQPTLYRGAQWLNFRISRDTAGVTEVATIIQKKGREPRIYRAVTENLETAYKVVKTKWERKKNRDGWSLEYDPDPLNEPMLLQRFDKKPTGMKGPWIVSPKMDGVRGIFQKGKLYSRKRQAFVLPHIQEALERLGILLDGEIWTEGMSWEAINSAVSRDTVDDEKLKLQFWIFDRADMPNSSYVDRLASLIDLSLPRCIQLTPFIYCKDDEEALKISDTFVSKGYEGAVARTPDGHYKFNTRSWDVLKIKPVDDAEYELQYRV
jgi:ATP-dependent DNA ligase